MNFKKTIFLSILIFLSATKSFSQNQSEAVPYKVKDYEVKKQLKVVELADQLKVDPEIILQLNHLRSTQRVLVTGLHIKIPVYAKGYKYEPATSPKVEEKAIVKKAEQKADSITQPLAKQQEKEKEKKEEKKPIAKTTAKENLTKEPQPVKTSAITQETRSNYNPEIDQNNLMLVDATLELDEAMLAGIKASLDTLSKPDPEIKNKNDVKEILQRMKRARDRKELIPYLEYMNDSLSLDCNKLHTQKQDILSRLTPYMEHQRLGDSAVLAYQNQPVGLKTTTSTTAKANKKNDKKQTVIATVVVRDTIANKKPLEAEKENQKQKDIKALAGHDTVIVYDLGKTAAIKPAKEKNQKLNAVAKADTVHKPVSDVVTRKQIAENKRGSWDTARAVIDSSLASKPKETIHQKQTAKAAADSSALAHAASRKPTTLSKTDSIVVAKKQPEPKPVEHKTIVADNSSSADTIQHIKSQFLLKRAQKAIAERKPKQAEEYLTKSLELWNNNYDAWMTLADQDAALGSPAKALKEYQECVRIDSSRPKLFYNIAALYLQGKKKTEAVQYFNKTIALDSNYILALMGRASVYSDWKKYNEAIGDYDKVLLFNKSYHYAYKARGMVKQLNKRFSEAVDDFTRYLIFEETDPSAYYYRGLAKIGNNELLEGCLDLSKSAEMGYDAAEKAIKKSCE